MRVFQLVKDWNDDRNIHLLVPRKTKRRQRYRGDRGSWSGYRSSNCHFRLRLRNPGNLWDQTGFDFIVDLCELRVFGAPFGIGGNNLFKVSVTRRCFSVRQLRFNVAPGLASFQRREARSLRAASSVSSRSRESRLVFCSCLRNRSVNSTMYLSSSARFTLLW